MNTSSQRATILFFAAYSLNATLHELSHAVTAYALGVDARIFHFFVDIDREGATFAQRAWIGVVGPVFSLLLGAILWILKTRARGRTSEMPLLYLATFGISIGLGNMFSIAFVGDMSRVAQLFEVPMPVRYSIAMGAAVALSAFTYRVGTELAAWAPREGRRGQAIIQLVVIPVVVGTALVLLVYWLPASFIGAWISPSVFWIFAAIGVARASNINVAPASSGTLQKSDVALAVVAAIVVRVLAVGIP